MQLKLNNLNLKLNITNPLLNKIKKKFTNRPNKYFILQNSLYFSNYECESKKSCMLFCFVRNLIPK